MSELKFEKHMNKNLNKRKCKQCGIIFQKMKPLQFVCSYKCGIDYVKKQRCNADKKDWNVRKNLMRSKLKTKKEYELELQNIVNEFIRLRDNDRVCISCCRELVGKFDAGHYYPVGSYKNLRYDEDNIHGQCVHCNQHKHGNLGEYTIFLPERIGNDRYDALIKRRLIPRHYSIPELIEMKVNYRAKIRGLRKILY